MHEIVCPHCGKAFTIDEAGYADIVTQVRTKEFDAALTERLHLAEQERLSALELQKAQLAAEAQRAASAKDAEIQQLKATLSAGDTAKQLAVVEAVAAVEKQRDALQGELKHAQYEKQLAETALKDKYETQIKDRDDAIERLKDMKAKLSTKMVGETLEQHCETQFNQIRATAFPTAYFEKDNDARSGSKGDYIFREEDATTTPRSSPSCSR